MFTSPIPLFAALVVGHFLCDFPLQGPFLAIAKNRWIEAPETKNVPWSWCMLAHVSIQAGMVWFVTGSPFCAALELIAHWIIDVEKCRGSFDFQRDEELHIMTKLVVVLIAGLTHSPTIFLR